MHATLPLKMSRAEGWTHPAAFSAPGTGGQRSREGIAHSCPSIPQHIARLVYLVVKNATDSPMPGRLPH